MSYQERGGRDFRDYAQLEERELWGFPGIEKAKRRRQKTHKKKTDALDYPSHQKTYRRRYPLGAAHRALGLKPGHSRDGKRRRERLLQEAYLALRTTSRASRRELQRLRPYVRRLRRRDQRRNWAEVVGFSLQNRFSISLGQFSKGDGLRLIFKAKGSEEEGILKSQDIFMGAFFNDDGEPLKRLAQALTDVDPRQMVVYFAQKPIDWENISGLSYSLGELTDEKDLNSQALRYSDLKTLFEEYRRKYVRKERGGRFLQAADLEFCFAQIYDQKGFLLMSLSFRSPEIGDQFQEVGPQKEVGRQRGDLIIEYQGERPIGGKNKMAFFRRVLGGVGEEEELEGGQSASVDRARQSGAEFHFRHPEF